MTWRAKTLPWARRAALWGALAGAAVQSAAVGGVIAADVVRRRRAGSPDVSFPRTDPLDARVADNDVTTYTYGDDVYDDMLAAIAGARRHVLFGSFIWKDDKVGRRFKEALEAAHRRGVEVFVVYDGFANLVVPRRFYDLPAGIHVLRFPVFRPGLLHLDLRHAGRDHRKMLIVDSEVGFVGGYNIGSTYATRWRDTHLRLSGPSVWELEDAFVDFWNEHRRRLPALPDRGARSWDARIRAARNAPNRMLFPVRGLYLDAIERATRRIWITQAYFIPDHEILTSLIAASKRGVDVQIIIPEYSNHVVADWVSRGYFTEMLEGGLSIHLYRDAMIHAKTAVVDGRWCTVGTANIDRLSLFGNYEINLEIHSPEQAAHLERVFQRDLTNCRSLTPQEWTSRAWHVKVLERVLAPLHPLL